MRALLAVLGVAIVGGLVGFATRIPAGPMVGAMVAVALARYLRPQLRPLPPIWGQGARILLGAVIGSAFTPAVLSQLVGLALPAAGLATLVFLSGLAGGLIVSRLTGLDLGTALFGCVPAGIAEMTAASEDAGCDASMVASIQFLRLATIVTLVPVLLALLAGAR